MEKVQIAYLMENDDVNAFFRSLRNLLSAVVGAGWLAASLACSEEYVCIVQCTSHKEAFFSTVFPRRKSCHHAATTAKHILLLFRLSFFFFCFTVNLSFALIIIC